MSLSPKQCQEIADLLTEKIRKKLADYSPETTNMPFHVRLLGKDRMALFSFVQSINTTLGTSVFEQVAAIIAKPHFKQAVNQFSGFEKKISSQAQEAIQSIMDELRTGREKPNKPAEIQKVLGVAEKGTLRMVKPSRVDLFLESRDGVEYYFDLKTAKPNIGDFLGYKRTLLEWVAVRGATDPKVKIRTLLAIPYNPYEPQPYERWTLQGLFDIPNEILVADEFWDFLGGDATYPALLKVFEEVGMALRPEIDAKFAKLS